MSRLLLCGGSGKVSRLLISLLSEYQVTAIIRDESKSSIIESLGATPKILSLDRASVAELDAVVQDQDVIVWSAGAGGKGGPDRTRAIDRDAAINMIHASGSRRFIMVSALTSRSTPASWWTESDVDKYVKGYEAIRVYHEAKVDADKALMASLARWTIVRPGSLTDEAGTGLVNAGRIHLDGNITRQDVARVIAAVLRNDGTIGLNIDVLNGSTGIEEAIDAVAKRQESTL